MAILMMMMMMMMNQWISHWVPIEHFRPLVSKDSDEWLYGRAGYLHGCLVLQARDYLDSEDGDGGGWRII